MYYQNPNDQRGNVQYQNQPGMGYPMTVQNLAPADRTSLMSKVMWFTGFSILAAITGGVFGLTNLTFRGSTYFIAVIAYFGLYFAAQAFRERPGLNFVLLYAFAFSSGVLVAPIIGAYLAAGLATVVLQALAVTAGMTFALGSYATVTKRNFLGIGGYLTAGLIGLLVVGLVQWILAALLGFYSPVINMAYSLFGAALFSVLIIFYIQSARAAQNTVGNAISITIGLYLAILNLFLFVLRILGMTSGGSRSNS